MNEKRALRGPGVRLGTQALGDEPALELAIGQAQLLEPIQVERVERAQLSGHLSRLDQCRLELSESLNERIEKTAEASRARKGAQLGSIEERADEQAALGITQRASRTRAVVELSEQVVEGSNPAGK